jgi:hypothetical protein
LVLRSRCTVRPCAGRAVFRGRTAPITVKRPKHPLFEFRVPPEFSTAKPGHPAAAGQHLSWAFSPYSTFRVRRSTGCGRLPTPATFRLQGLVTLWTVSSLGSRAGFVSHRQRSWDSPFGGFPFRKAFAASPPERTHLPLACMCHRHRSAGPAKQASVSGFTPSGSTLRPYGLLSRRSPAPPLGFAPLGLSREGLDQDFSRSPLARFANPSITRRIRRRPRVSIGPRLASTTRAPRCTSDEAALLGFLHRPHPDHSNLAPPGLLSSPCTGSHITADSPVLFGR